MSLLSQSFNSHIEAIAVRLSDLLQNAGYTAVFPPILQPLEVFLEYSGEDIRKRLYSVSDISGGEYCLRPDLTIPTCRQYLASQHGQRLVENRLCYHGTAFRYHSSGSCKPSEFIQTGAEFFGASNQEEADAEIMALAIDGLRSIGCDGFEAEIGDLRLFHAFADKIAENTSHEISFWVRQLKQLFHQSDKSFRRLLEQAATAPEIRPNQYTSQDEDLVPLFSITLDTPMGGRGIDEIKARFCERMERQRLPQLPQNTTEALESFLRIRAPFPKALEKIDKICASIDVDISPVLNSLQLRAECLSARGIDLETTCFSSDFGRRLGYYTSFAFELRYRDIQIATGGRYDQLLQALGSDKVIPAVGFATRPDRIATLWPEVASKLSAREFAP